MGSRNFWYKVGYAIGSTAASIIVLSLILTVLILIAYLFNIGGCHIWLRY